MELTTLVVLLSAGAVQARGAGPPLQPAPASIIVGTDDGKIVRCRFDNPDVCETFHEGAGGRITATLIHGEYLFASVGNYKIGKILRCEWNLELSCDVYYKGTEFIRALAISNGYLFAGDDAGRLLKCRLNNPLSCTVMHSFEMAIIDMFVVYHSYMYIATASFVTYCLIDLDCSEDQWLHNQVIQVQGPNNKYFRKVTYLTNAIITISNHDDHVRRFIVSSPNTIFFKNNESIRESNNLDITVFRRKLYLLTYLDDIMVSEERDNKYKLFAQNVSPWATSISFVYATHPMQPTYPRTASTCLEQNRPSALFNYGVDQRSQLEARVVHGKLRDARGALVDTRRADRGRSGHAAVFAMGPGGQLLLSATHRRSSLVHITSLFSGGAVAGAGEIEVVNGVVKRIVACSVYYLPTVTLNRQVVDELYRQGYDGEEKIVLEDCPSMPACDIIDSIL